MTYLGTTIVEYQIMLREPSCAQEAIITVTQASGDGDVQAMLDNFTRLH